MHRLGAVDETDVPGGHFAAPAGHPRRRDAGWVHVYNTTGTVSVARRAAEAVLRGGQEHVADCTAELQRRRDTIIEALPELPIIRPGGGWSLLVDVAALGMTPADASRMLLEEAGVAATGMTGWGGDVAARHVRFVYSAEPVDRLRTLRERVTVLSRR